MEKKSLNEKYLHCNVTEGDSNSCLYYTHTEFIFQCYVSHNDIKMNSNLEYILTAYFFTKMLS